MKKTQLFLFALLLSCYLFACTQGGNAIEPPKQTPPPGAPQQMEAEDATDKETGSLVYQNTQYGFGFTLPASWQGYWIITEKWEGLGLEGTQGQQAIETGPLLSIRHPQWTAEKPRQDIPILVFTPDQWNQLQQGKFHIGAAPMGPMELGRNSKHVFALPARYNYAFSEGFEEVEEIIVSNPLHAE